MGDSHNPVVRVSQIKIIKEIIKMLFIVGTLIVIGCVIGGYMAGGGHLDVLWQPLEFLIIFGAGIGGFVIANPMPIIKGTLKGFGLLIKGSPYTPQRYEELLTMMGAFFKLVRTKGVLAVESHIENPHESTFFEKYPGFYKDHHAVEFFCDYMRLISLGTTDPNMMEDLLNAELEAHHKEMHQVSGAVATIADGMPALGIVAAVLGVIHTMGSITEPPEILGHLIGAALVGTFSGVLIAYGFVGPMAKSMENTFDAEGRYYDCIKQGIMGYLNNQSPVIIVELARKTLFHDVRPGFAQMEEAMANAPAE